MSWTIWNWRILYLTFFVDNEFINKDKISIITENYSDYNHLITYPVISTIIIILILPFVSNKIVEQNDIGRFKFTALGNDLAKLMINESLNKSK